MRLENFKQEHSGEVCDLMQEHFYFLGDERRMKKLLLPLVGLESNDKMVPIFASTIAKTDMYPPDVLHFYASTATLSPIPMPTRQHVNLTRELNAIPMTPALWN